MSGRLSLSIVDLPMLSFDAMALRFGAGVVWVIRTGSTVS
jgi:hypothetical protein